MTFISFPIGIHEHVLGVTMLLKFCFYCLFIFQLISYFSKPTFDV